MPSVGGAQTISILVADDDYGHRRMLELVLSAYQYRVTCAQDGQEALDLLSRATPDLLILDVDMPRLGGFEVCDQVRTEPRLRDLPVIIMTGKSPEKIVARAERSSPDALIYKPISGNDLRSLIGDLVVKRVSERL